MEPLSLIKKLVHSWDTSSRAPGEQRHYEVRAAPCFGSLKETYVALIRFRCLFARVKLTKLPFIIRPFEYQTHCLLVPFDTKSL